MTDDERGDADRAAADQPTIRLGLGVDEADGGDGERRPPWVLPTAIGVAVVLIAGLVFLASRDDSGGEAGDASTTTEALSSSTERAEVAITEPTNAAAGSESGSDSTATVASSAGAATTPADEAATTITTAADAPASTAAPGGDGSGTTTTATSSPAAPTTAAAPTVPTAGRVVIDDVELGIEQSCEEVPFGEQESSTIASYLVRDPTVGRIVIERTEGSTNVVDVRWIDAGSASAATEITDLGGGAVDVTVDGPTGAPTRVAFAPPPAGAEFCLDTIVLAPPDGSADDAFIAGILDVCTVPSGDGFAVAGIGTSGTVFSSVPNGDEADFGESAVTLTVSAPLIGGPLVDDNAIAAGDVSVVFIEGLVSGGGITRAAFIEVELAAPRSCSPIEAP